MPHACARRSDTRAWSCPTPGAPRVSSMGPRPGPARGQGPCPRPTGASAPQTPGGSWAACDRRGAPDPCALDSWVARTAPRFLRSGAPTTIHLSLARTRPDGGALLQEGLRSLLGIPSSDRHSEKGRLIFEAFIERHLASAVHGLETELQRGRGLARQEPRE